MNVTEKRYAKIPHIIILMLLFCCVTINAQAAPILKLNSQGHDVTILQQNLVRLNYNLTKVSGIFDNETLEAVKAFQKDNNLQVTGIVNRETWWAIKGTKKVTTNNNTNNSSKLPVVKNPVVIKNDKTNSKDKDKVSNKDKHDKRPVDDVIWGDLTSVPYGRPFLAKAEVTGIISTAKDYMGVPYVFGGDTPEGFDCSGYLEYVFAKHGIRIPRTADEQYKLGKLVKQTDLVPGDLVFFTTYEPGASHCGIYLGNGNFIHASTSKGVRIDNLKNSYWVSKYYGGKHIVK